VVVRCEREEVRDGGSDWALRALQFRNPFQSCRALRFDPGHRSDLMPAGIPK
jgi:hypothetical protein